MQPPPPFSRYISEKRIELSNTWPSLWWKEVSSANRPFNGFWGPLVIEKSKFWGCKRNKRDWPSWIGSLRSYIDYGITKRYYITIICTNTRFFLNTDIFKYFTPLKKDLHVLSGQEFCHPPHPLNGLLTLFLFNSLASWSSRGECHFIHESVICQRMEVPPPPKKKRRTKTITKNYTKV